MKRILSAILVIMIVFCFGFAMAYAEPVILPESADTPIVVPNSGGLIINNNTGNGGGSIVIVDPYTNKPVQTPQPAPTYSIVDIVPSVTKNPTAESVDAGSEVVFVAHSDTATDVNWYLTNGETYIPASEVGNHFTGVTAAGANTDRLVLSNVSDKMDGWSAVARFDNAAGSAWSNQAKLTVAPDPNAAPSPTPTPLPTVAPTPTPVPANMPNGGGSGNTATQHGLNNLTQGNTVGNSNNTAIGNTGSGNDINNTGISGAPIQTTTASNGSGGSARNNHIGAYVLAAVAGLVIIGSVLVMALYMKGKISLGKFEKFLGSFGNENDAEMFDNSGEFYNPDDFKDKNNKT